MLNLYRLLSWMLTITLYVNLQVLSKTTFIVDNIFTLKRLISEINFVSILNISFINWHEYWGIALKIFIVIFLNELEYII
jgi:hypothetical protein